MGTPHAVLPLTIHSSDDRAFPFHAVTEVHTWRDLSGQICAHGYVGAGERWMRWPGVVAFRFDDRGRMDAYPEPAATAAQVVDLWRRSAEPIVRQALGAEALHASAVRTAAGIVAFCGEREAGKSTIAYGLSRRGCAQHADDALVIEVLPGSIRALSLPFGVRLRPEAASFYGFGLASGAPLHDVLPMTTPDDRGPTSLPLAAVFVLGRSPAGPPAAVRLSSARAFTALLAHAHCFDPSAREGRRRLVANYLAIAARVPVFELRFSPGLGGLDDVMACVESTVTDLRTAPCT